MSIGPLVNLASGFIQSLFPGQAHGSSSTNASTNTASAGGTQDTNQSEPFAQILNSLRQLEQSSFSQYQKVTNQIAGSLQTGAQSAAANGNTILANQLTKLSTDFTNASGSFSL